jgi:hypothetical protein
MNYRKYYGNKRAHIKVDFRVEEGERESKRADVSEML